MSFLLAGLRYLKRMGLFSGTIPHPNGKITVRYKLERSKWKISISLPTGTMGEFKWKEKSYPLKEGENSFVI